MKRSGPPSSGRMVDRHAQQPARRRARRRPGRSRARATVRLDGGVLAHGDGIGACGCEGLTSQRQKCDRAKKNGLEESAHLHAFSGKPELYPMPVRNTSGKTPRGCQGADGGRRRRPACQNPPLTPRSRSTTMGFLAGKRFLITGVLSNRSIAYGIARACRREGAELAFSYQGERFKERIAEFAAEFGSEPDLRLRRRRRRADRGACSPPLGEAWPSFDGFVHSIGFAPARGDRRRLPRRPVARGVPDRPRHLELQLPGDGQGGAAAPAPRRGAAHADLPGRACAACPTTTRWAWPRRRWRPACATWRPASARKGVRVNGISAGPIKTLAASGIKGFGKILDVVDAQRAAAPQRDDRRRRQRRRLPAVRPGRRRHLRDHLRRRRLQPRDGAAPTAA